MTKTERRREHKRKMAEKHAPKPAWMTPRKLDGADVVFGCNVLDYMPKMEEIPSEFCQYPGTRWNQLVSDWFFNGVHDLKLVPKPNVDRADALKVVRSIIGSFEPKHEHKEAAAAYLLSLWFESAEWKSGERRG